MSEMHNILIIDDQAEDCKDIERAIRKVYEEGDVRIFVAYSYLDALAIIYNQKISITVMFIDVVLGDEEKNGISIAEEIFAYRQDLPFVIISGYYFEKVKEVNSRLLGLEQYIGFLDKSEYMPDDILDVMCSAEKFILKKHEDVDFSLPSRNLHKKDLAFEELLKLIVRNNIFHKKALEDIENADISDQAFILDFLGNFDRNPKRLSAQRFHGTPAMEFRAKHNNEEYRIFAKLGKSIEFLLNLVIPRV